MTWKEYEDKVGTLKDSWERVQQLSGHAWSAQQLKLLETTPVTFESDEVYRILRDMGSQLIEPALNHIRDSLRPIVNSCGEPQYDQSAWSPSHEWAAQVLEQIVRLLAENHFQAGDPNNPPLWLRNAKELRDGYVNNFRHLATLTSQAVAVYHAMHIGNTLQHAAGLREQAEDVLRSANQLRLEVALTAEARWYAKSSDSFGRQADGWLLGLAFAGVALISVLAFFIFSAPKLQHGGESWTVASNLAHFGPRVALVSLLSTFVLVCIREQRAARHNQVVNLYRSNTVMTVRELAKSGDTKHSETILTLAAQAVFLPATTGFDKPSSGAVASPWLAHFTSQNDG